MAFDHRRDRGRENGSRRNERKVTASAESSGAVNVIFPVHDRFESRFDPRTFCSLSIFKHSEEGSHKRETSIHFDYARKKSALDEKNLKTGETKHVENDLAGCATDVITGFYYLQSLPLQLGASYEFPISDGKTTIVRATVEKREQIRVPAGTFPGVMVTAEAISGPLQVEGQSVGVVFGGCESHAGANARQAGMGHAAVSPAADREVRSRFGSGDLQLESESSIDVKLRNYQITNCSSLPPPASPSPVPGARSSDPAQVLTSTA